MEKLEQPKKAKLQGEEVEQGEKAVVGFEDRRPEAVEQGNLQKAANESEQVQQFGEMQRGVNKSPQVQQLAQLKSAVNVGGNQPIQRKVSSKYQAITNLLSRGIIDWTVSQAEGKQAISMLHELSDQDLTDTVAKLKKDGYLENLMGSLGSPNAKGAAQPLYFRVIEKVKEIDTKGKLDYEKPKDSKGTYTSGSFTQFITIVNILEEAARKDGYSTKQIITALRKRFYNSSPEKKIGGVTVGGGGFGILIPDAQDTKFPPSWSSEDLKPIFSALKQKKEVTIGAHKVDLGHLLTGLDAANHPKEVTIGKTIGPMGLDLTMRSNIEATTWTGDLGSVVGEYIMNKGAKNPKKAAKDDFWGKPKKGEPADSKPKSTVELTQAENKEVIIHYMNRFISEGDTMADIDAYNVSIDPSFTIAENLSMYYHNMQKNPVSKRYTGFAQRIGLLKEDGTIAGDFPQAASDEVFAAAIAYIASKGRKLEAIGLMGEDATSPQYWAYRETVRKVLLIFLEKVCNEVDAEKEE